MKISPNLEPIAHVSPYRRIDPEHPSRKRIITRGRGCSPISREGQTWSIDVSSAIRRLEDELALIAAGLQKLSGILPSDRTPAQKERGPACLGDRVSHRVRPSRRPCSTVTHAPAVVGQNCGSMERNLLGVAPVTQQPPDGAR